MVIQSQLTARMLIGRRGTLIGVAVVVAQADAEGRYALRLAQASDDGVAGSWQLEAGPLAETLHVPLAAIRDGATLLGPDFSHPAN